jgi:hypothetical protein
VLPARYGAEVLRQLLVALEHVHDAGLVHRDVKPANVLLEPTGTGIPHARLADFGLVLTADRPRITGMFMVVGTRDYLAPESLENGDQGVAQDLYAAGLVGAEMVGTHAGPLAGLIAALTASEPERRPESATAALEQLAEILHGWPLYTPTPVPESDEPVEVFDQIGELPPGWGPGGPIAEAETETVEWLWSPDPAEEARAATVEYGGDSSGSGGRGVSDGSGNSSGSGSSGGSGSSSGSGGSGSVEGVEFQTRVLGSMPGADQRTIPATGTPGGRQIEGSQGGSSGERRAGGSQGGSSGEQRAGGPQAGGASNSWQAQTVPFGGRPGGASGDQPVDGSPGDGASGNWQERTLPLPGKSGGASSDWHARTVPLPGKSGSGSSNTSGDWQARTVPLGGTPSRPSRPVGNRPAWNPNPPESDMDRVRLVPVFNANPGGVPASPAAPSVSDRRRRWLVMVAAAVAVAVIGVLVLAFH